MYWQGDLLADSSAIFRLPVPIEIKISGRGLKRITVAVATASQVQAWGVAEYLGAETKFWLFRDDTDFDKIEAMLQREEAEKNVMAAENVDNISGNLGITRRSAGSLQCDIFEWNDHKDKYSSDEYSVAVSLKAASWNSKDAQIPTAIVARIKDCTGKCQEIYEQVRVRV